ncbi:MAG: ABC transporter ATP-binding protein [Candidatus Paceibacterota bacterium]
MGNILKPKKSKKKPEITFRQNFSKLMEFYRPFWGVIAISLFLTFLQEVLSLVAPYVYGRIIDGVIANRALVNIIYLAGIFFLVYVLNEVVIFYIRQRIEITRFDSDFSDSINRKSLAEVFRFSIGQHENQNSGIKKSIIDRGLNALPAFTMDWLYQVLPLTLQVVVTLIALSIIAPVLGAIVFVGLSIYILTIVLANKQLSGKLRDVQEMRNDTDKKQAEFLRNASLVKTNAKEKEILKEYDEKLSHTNRLVKLIWLKYIDTTAIRTTVLAITRVAVMVVGIYLVYQKVYTPGFLVIFLSWSSNAFNRLWSLSYLQRNIVDYWSAIKNLFALLSMEPAIKEVENPIVLEKIQGRIEYKNVFFKYPSREDADEPRKNIKKTENTLKNVNLVIEPGQKVAIVGHSGAGKSSLAQLLIRAYDPDQGKILIDGNDLKELSLDKYRDFLGVVPQDVSLFDNTLRYNILFGAKSKVSDRQLNEAVKMARIDTFLKSLEKGLDTTIGEKGIRLSGGERQRVGIARALVKDPSILIFDEATSSLDVENEALIRESIEKAAKGRTTIIIAHRLSTIKDADKIIVLENGKIIGEGKHKHLLKTCEPYRKMINIQTVIVGGN